MKTMLLGSKMTSDFLILFFVLNANRFLQSIINVQKKFDVFDKEETIVG